MLKSVPSLAPTFFHPAMIFWPRRRRPCRRRGPFYTLVSYYYWLSAFVFSADDLGHGSRPHLDHSSSLLLQNQQYRPWVTITTPLLSTFECECQTRKTSRRLERSPPNCCISMVISNQFTTAYISDTLMHNLNANVL